MRTQKRIAIIIMTVIFVLTMTVSAVCERVAWDCPECGKKGNTGKFCGGCGHPAPTNGGGLSESAGNGSFTVGDLIEFGHYEQDGNVDNGPEAIEWIVLDVQDGKGLLLSKCGLDAKPYNESTSIYRPRETATTWEQCSLRKWLNKDFYQAAFSDDEQGRILTTEVDNSDAQRNKEWDTDGGENTADKIFLLSHYEVFKKYKQYLMNNDAAECIVTPYAIKRGAYYYTGYQTDGKLTGVWWLRSPGSQQNCAEYMAYIVRDIKAETNTADWSSVCVRPALWMEN